MSAAPTSALLDVKAVAKAFSGNHVLQDVSFSVASGEIVGLLGPNGSGKSTLLNTINGFETIDRGAIRLAGDRIDGLPVHRVVAAGIGRTFQLPSMPRKMSVLEVAVAAATAHHGIWATLARSAAARRTEQAALKKAGQLLDQLLLAPVRDLPAAALSGGQKKLLGIVCALMAQPRLLILDEPTAGVHPNLRRDIVAALRDLNAQGMTMLIVEHDMQFIREVCTRCIVLDRGRIVADCRPDELVRNEEVVRAYLGRAEEPELEEALP
jgi:branched-chain amino acid transport system ATP-binding protein